MLSCINFNYVCKSSLFDASFLQLDESEQGSIIRNNVIIRVSGAEGLSSPEVLTPSGIYIRNPTNVVEVRSAALPGRSELRGHNVHSGSCLEWRLQWCGIKYLPGAHYLVLVSRNCFMIFMLNKCFRINVIISLRIPVKTL